MAESTSRVGSVQAAETSLKSWPRDVVGLLALLTALLIYFQYTTLDKFKALSPAVRYVYSDDAIEFILSRVSLTVSDAIAFFFILIVTLVLVGLEIWGRRISIFFRYVFLNEWRTLLVLCLSSLVLVRFYFALGVLNWSGDGSSHICYAWLASHSFSQGEIPIWTNYLGTGSPYLQFYGFLFFYVVGVLAQIVGDLDWTMKLVLAGAHVASGLGMYLFVRRLSGSRQAGFVAGLGFVLCVWHMQQTLIMGRFPLSLFYALLPLPFYFIERLRFGILPNRAVVGGGVTLGLLAFVHPGYAFWSAAAVALYIGLRTLTARLRIGRLRFAISGFVLWVSGLVFGAYLTLPMWVERALVDLEEIRHSDVPDPTWGHLLLWSNYRFHLFAFEGNEHWYGGYLGLSLVLLALIGLYGITSKKTRSLSLAVSVCFVISFILVMGYRWPGISSLELVRAFNAGRYLLFVSFFLAVLAGVGMLILKRLFPAQRSLWCTIAIMVIMVDLGPTTFQHPYAEPNKTFLNLTPEFAEEIESRLDDFPDGQIPNTRLSYPMDNMFDLLGIAWFTTQVGVPSFLTGYREGPRAQTVFCMPVQKFLESLLGKQNLETQLQNNDELLRLKTGLYLLNTQRTYVVESQTRQLVSIDWSDYSPIVVAPEIRGFIGRGDDMERAEILMRDMEVDRRRNTSRRIFVNEEVDGVHLQTDPEIEVINHQVWNQRVVMDVVVSTSCFARLSYAHYPFLGVYVDGEPVTVLRTAGDFIAIKLTKGKHRIELKPHLSTLRKTLLGVDLLWLILAGIILWREQKNYKEAA